MGKKIATALKLISKKKEKKEAFIIEGLKFIKLSLKAFAITYITHCLRI